MAVAVCLLIPVLHLKAEPYIIPELIQNQLSNLIDGFELFPFNRIYEQNH
jgi:hypothetical protein